MSCKQNVQNKPIGRNRDNFSLRKMAVKKMLLTKKEAILNNIRQQIMEQEVIVTNKTNEALASMYSAVSFDNEEKLLEDVRRANHQLQEYKQEYSGTQQQFDRLHKEGYGSMSIAL